MVLLHTQYCFEKFIKELFLQKHHGKKSSHRSAFFCTPGRDWVLKAVWILAACHRGSTARSAQVQGGLCHSAGLDA